MHYVTGHHHNDQVQLHDGDGCGDASHYHAYHLDAECSICDFNFSPEESEETILLPPFAPQVYSPLFSDLTFVLFENEGAPATLRGPPSPHFI